MHHVLPPGILDILAQFDPERAVIVKSIYSAVDLGGLKNESPSLTEGNDVIHGRFEGRCFGHKSGNKPRFRKLVKT